MYLIRTRAYSLVLVDCPFIIPTEYAVLVHSVEGEDNTDTTSVHTFASPIVSECLRVRSFRFSCLPYLFSLSALPYYVSHAILQLLDGESDDLVLHIGSVLRALCNANAQHSAQQQEQSPQTKDSDHNSTGPNSNCEENACCRLVVESCVPSLIKKALMGQSMTEVETMFMLSVSISDTNTIICSINNFCHSKRVCWCIFILLVTECSCRSY